MKNIPAGEPGPLEETDLEFHCRLKMNSSNLHTDTPTRPCRGRRGGEGGNPTSGSTCGL